MFGIENRLFVLANIIDNLQDTVKNPAQNNKIFQD